MLGGMNEASALRYQSSSYRLASLGAAAFIAVLGLALAVFTVMADAPVTGAFYVVELAVTIGTSGWLFLGTRVQVTVGDGEVHVRTKTRDGHFPVADVEGFECRPGTVGGIPIGSQYVFLLKADGPLNTWSPAPGPVERDGVIAGLNARVETERRVRPSAAPMPSGAAADDDPPTAPPMGPNDSPQDGAQEAPDDDDPARSTV